MRGMAKSRTMAAAQLLAQYGRPVATSPVDAALELMYEAHGNVAFLRERVRESNSLVISGKMERDEIAGLVRLYNDERDRLAKLSESLMRIGIAERQVRLYESQARAVVDIVKKVIDAANLNPEQRKAAIAVAVQEMRNSVRLAPNPMTVDAPYATSNDDASEHVA
jgi:hypothetical protein